MILPNDAQLKRDIKVDEGFRGYAYRDSEGYLTIGYGHLIDIRSGGGIDLDILELILERDIEEAVKTCVSLFPTFGSLTDERQRVLVNMCFNLGYPKLAKFYKMRAAVQAGDYEKAADEMLDSLWAEQVGDRAKRLAERMRKG